MMRMTGMAVIVFSSTAIGLRMAAELQGRVQALKELERLMAILKGEIGYASTPLQEAFRELAERSGAGFNRFFLEAARMMELREGKRLGEIFEKCADRFLSAAGLAKQDREQFVRMGKRLGYLDRDMQVQTIRLYQEELSRERKEAEEDYRQKAKVYRSLGFLGGCFIVLLLL